VLPKNPLDDLIERLGGPDAVAEMTGRQKRMEKQPKGGYSYVSRSAQYGRCSLDDVSAAAATFAIFMHRCPTAVFLECVMNICMRDLRRWNACDSRGEVQKR
jgi:hypothetical protein